MKIMALMSCLMNHFHPSLSLILRGSCTVGEEFFSKSFAIPKFLLTSTSENLKTIVMKALSLSLSLS